ncbi:hypothetical protein DFH08DRAFT_124346 [Mycena albidolilacea]|uniref:Extracellular conserved serine-rich protein n=1 Tax=Mycena albidolilacea TaxID=1033008 RepID=A0AAD7A531_9AGAR|nr:hypothetical protein DFH08DRAFT_124346 [Mycena albidolilacea]
MFTQLCLSLALAAASTRALTINTPTNPTSGGTTSITWSSTSDDPVFSIELNHPSFNSALAIANNVNPADNNRTVGLPPVPAEDNYTLTFVNITNINDVFATSGSFSIGAAVSSSSGRSTASASGSVTQSGSASQASATSPAVSGSGSPSASNSGSGPSPSPTGSAAAGLRAPVVALFALVGAAFVL